MFWKTEDIKYPTMKYRQEIICWCRIKIWDLANTVSWKRLSLYLKHRRLVLRATQIWKLRMKTEEHFKIFAVRRIIMTDNHQKKKLPGSMLN